MINLIATDIDGTLVEDGCSTINPEYFDVIRQLKEKGIFFVAASGRQYASIAKLFEPVKDDIIFIAENGAFVSCRGTELLVESMDKKTTDEIISDIRNLKDCQVLASGKYVAYTDTKDKDFVSWLIEGYHFDLLEVDDLLKVEEPFIKVSIYHKEDATKASEDTFIPKWKERVKVVCAGEMWMDSMKACVNKGAALNKIQNTLMISPEETMAFGDNLNDIEMLHAAKESYAIGNARTEVKDAAKYIADTNVNDGVLKEIKKLL